MIPLKFQLFYAIYAALSAWFFCIAAAVLIAQQVHMQFALLNFQVRFYPHTCAWHLYLWQPLSIYSASGALLPDDSKLRAIRRLPAIAPNASCLQRIHCSAVLCFGSLLVMLHHRWGCLLDDALVYPKAVVGLRRLIASVGLRCWVFLPWCIPRVVLGAGTCLGL